ncbi:ferrochelatase-1, chloroplastic-like [Chenopodium quinoa]|uniref:ferrochelatase-1, chloroplastic-like n=1 Tax=Chenopodium quinoa TaxID=63459 RepID=UPI000B77D252|nr:ferrochelatase-1, chloroplastic-like [Chenopodium quinoa]XP_021749935.1 ferrochelatase-1, chloroplastic-like [Chenopodium quinoa]XP_021749936.1 ferrochelatase-1, chloroplastic-like [Chenopodium quinoa]
MDATSSSAVVSQLRLSSPSLRNSKSRFFESCPQIRNCMPPCKYTCRNSSSSSYTIMSSDSVESKSSSISGFSYSQPEKRSNEVGKTFCSAALYTSTYDEDLAIFPSHVAEEKIGVLLLNLGGPDTLNDVQPFLFNLFADPDIIRLPSLFRFLQRPLAQLISMLRAPKSKEGYASIGGGSPLRKITDEQANALKLALEAKNKNVSVYVGMRYWYPFTEEAVQQIKKDKITRLVVLPLYPQFSISTTGSSLRVLQNIFREDAYLSRVPVAIIRSWYQREGYVKSMADLIEKELQSFSMPDEVMIFFSAHGVPVSYVEDAGDPYKDQMEDCIFLIMRELKARGINNRHTLAYQSRVGPVQWLQPYTDKVLVELGQKGVKSLLAVPVSFVSEHIETLEEIDMEYKELALESGIENWGRVPALNCTSSFINDLADAVTEALPSAAAITTSTSEEVYSDPVNYFVKLFFGSLLAFILLLSPKIFLAFRNNLL